MFLGIPYAAPPTGNCAGSLRSLWRGEGARRADPMEPHARKPWIPNWNGYEQEMQTFEPYYSLHTDEDCLYLNVWTTNLPAAGRIAAKLPVMFWIHGGGDQ